MRLLGTKTSSINQSRGLGNQLWDLAGSRPSLDLRFAENKSLVDAVTGASLITHTRASSGTYVNSAGVLQTAVTNLLPRSEEFNDASWAKDFTTATANVAVAPNGATTADKVAEDSSNNFHTISQYVTGFASGAIVILSVYAKAAGRTKFRIQTDATAGSGTTDFNLSSVSVDGQSGIFSNGSIVPVGNDWYRCSVRCTTSSAGAVGLKIILSQSTYGTVYTGDGTSGLFLWGAQLEQSATVGEYIPTTSTINSAPRFDHNPQTGESLGLLVEEQRTNLLVRSEEIGTSPWGTNGSGSVAYTANATAAPTGAVTADRVTATADYAGPNQFLSVTSGLPYALSFYVKAVTPGSLNVIRIECLGLYTTFNITTRVFSGTQAGITSTSSVALADGWVRVQCLFTAPSTGSLAASIYANTSSDFYLWGAQLEAGAFPTSYIPTTTAAATRSADVASITGTNFSSWYNQTEGTVFASAVTNARHGGINSFPRIASVSDGTNNNLMETYYRVLSSYTDAGYGVINTGTPQASFDTNDNRNGQNVALGYASNNFPLAVGGTVVATDTSGTVPTVSRLALGARGDGTTPLNGTIRRLTYWPQRLADTTLQVITQ